jgi:transcriptional regulator with XRE-family HTH domain
MQTIGERLEEARKRRGISLREAAEATKIRADFLQNLENNHFDFDLPELYVRGFLRNYAVYLRISPDKVVADYNAMQMGNTASRDRAKDRFGRIELLKSTSEPEADKLEQPETTPVAAQAAPTRRDQDNRIKLAVVIGSGVVVLLIVVMLIRLVVSGFSNSPVPAAGGATPAAQLPQTTEIFLLARDTVDVTVTSRGDGSTIFRGTLRSGTRHPLRITGQVRITTPNGERLEVQDPNGKVWQMPQDGYSNAIFPPQ